MKTFKDINFKQHRLGKGYIQGLLMLDNGIELSVVAGQGMYSAGTTGVRTAVNKVKHVSSFEVGVIDKNGNMNDLPLGWQGREDIDNLIKSLS